MTRKSRLGRTVPITSAGERVEAFVPPPLPPDPPVRMEGLHRLLEEANRGLGQLGGMCRVLPDRSPFLYAHVRKEALLSCQIEGTRSSLSDVLMSEKVRPVPADGVRDVSNYVDAMEHGLKRVRDEDFPISQRLMLELHGKLLAGERGKIARPGEYRRSQNWIGGTRPGNAVYVPPPHHMLPDLMSDLERFIHASGSGLPDLVKAGLVHVQFETIHPFLDGNGRLGRLLITLLLCARGILREPLLCLSLHFKIHRARYYELLLMVREKGAWEDWLAFFLEGVRDTAHQAADSIQRTLDLFERDRERIAKAGGRSRSVFRLHEFMQRNPVFSVPEAARQLELTPPTIRSGIEALARLGMVAPIGTTRRPRYFAYGDYLKILRPGTDPL